VRQVIQQKCGVSLNCFDTLGFGTWEECIDANPSIASMQYAEFRVVNENMKDAEVDGVESKSESVEDAEAEEAEVDGVESKSESMEDAEAEEAEADVVEPKSESVEDAEAEEVEVDEADEVESKSESVNNSSEPIEEIFSITEKKNEDAKEAYEIDTDTD